MSDGFNSTETGNPVTTTYTYVDTKELIVTQLKVALLNQGTDALYENIRVMKSDPKDMAEMPCIGVNLVNGDEDGQGISDTIAETVYDQTTGLTTEYKGTYFKETIEVRVWHPNPAERDKLRIFVKQVLFGMRRDVLVPAGLLNISQRGGRDEQDNNYAPKVIYWHAENLDYWNPLEAYATSSGTAITADGEGSAIPAGQ